MEQRLGIAIGLRRPLEHQRARRLIGDALRLAARHGNVKRVAGILHVDLRRHLGEGRVRLLGRHDAMHQPVGHMLGGDAQGRAVLHQADVVDVRHLGAADALIDPAHDIAQDTLRIILQFLGNLLRLPVMADRDGHSQERGKRCDSLRFALRLVEAVIMGGVQRRGGAREHRSPHVAIGRALVEQHGTGIAQQEGGRVEIAQCTYPCLLGGRARVGGYVPATTYREAVGSICDELANAEAGDDWQARFPILASYPYDLFDYAAEDAFACTLR